MSKEYPLLVSSDQIESPTGWTFTLYQEVACCWYPCTLPYSLNPSPTPGLFLSSPPLEQPSLQRRSLKKKNKSSDHWCKDYPLCFVVESPSRWKFTLYQKIACCYPCTLPFSLPHPTPFRPTPPLGPYLLSPPPDQPWCNA